MKLPEYSEADMLAMALRVEARVAEVNAKSAARKALKLIVVVGEDTSGAPVIALSGADELDESAVWTRRELLSLDVKRINQDIAAACRHVSVNLPDNYFATGKRTITLDGYFSLVQQRLSALAARNAQLEAELDGTARSMTTTIERNEKGQMSRLIETDSGFQKGTPSRRAGRLGRVGDRGGR